MVTKPTHYRSFNKQTLATLTCCFLSLLSVDYAFAQAPTTVQLPTLRQFSVGTTVVVPDGGSAFLGGVNSHQSGSTSAGVPILGRLPGIGRAFNNRAFGVNDGSRQARVKATIIDLDEMDAAILNNAARRDRKRIGGLYAGDTLLNGKGAIRGGGMNGGVGHEDEVTRQARYLTRNMGRSSVATTKKTSPRKSTSSATKSLDSHPKTAEPPLILNGRK